VGQASRPRSLFTGETSVVAARTAAPGKTQSQRELSIACRSRFGLNPQWIQRTLRLGQSYGHELPSTMNPGTFARLLAPLLLIVSLCTAQEIAPGPAASGIPVQITQPADLKFKRPSFTFVRIKYSVGQYGLGHTPERWKIDWPDSDLNFSARFQKVTGLKTDTNGVVLELTDPRLKLYPFIYIVEPGRLDLRDAEVPSLRAYLLGGGFLMMDDFWGEGEWSNIQRELKRVFPEREPVELSIEHPVFHSFYDLKEKPQVPGIAHARAGRTYEGGPDGKEVHYRGLFDDSSRLMVILCHNTDLGDGWERESEDANYYREYSQKKAYPMGINIVVYALTH
jgi:hypothetical protein